jgi:RNA polymerase sigma-70 factor (ECF subfamily)
MRSANRDAEFERLLGTHAGALARLAASYESRPALREELLQDIAFAIWRALPSFRHEASEKTFVMRIATNRAMSHLAARAREKGTEGSHPFARADADPLVESSAKGCDPFEDTGVRPEEEAVRRQQAERLVRAVGGLPLPQRQVVVLALEGMDHGEIAAVLGLTAGNVAVRLHRGKGLLRAALEESP